MTKVGKQAEYIIVVDPDCLFLRPLAEESLCRGFSLCIPFIVKNGKIVVNLGNGRQEATSARGSGGRSEQWNGRWWRRENHSDKRGKRMSAEGEESRELSGAEEYRRRGGGGRAVVLT
eukprot:766786-Hanusia_phi.AAC.4